MKKRDFIQHCHALSMLHADKPSGKEVQDFAARRWEWLTSIGFGDSKQHQPKESAKNWYKCLSDYQRKWFDVFWKTFCTTGFTGGKQGAAMRWSQLGEPSEDVYQNIVDAAKAEAEQRSVIEAQGGRPIMAQGWLSKRRYDDHVSAQETLPNKREEERQERIRDLMGDITHYGAMKGDVAADQVKRAKSELKKLGVKHG